jgi:hypothetical protein
MGAGCSVDSWRLAAERGVSPAVVVVCLPVADHRARAEGSFGLLDMTPYGRGEGWEDKPEDWPEDRNSCWYWRSDADGNATWGPTSRPVPQWTRPGATPVETLGRHGHHH